MLRLSAIFDYSMLGNIGYSSDIYHSILHGKEESISEQRKFAIV